MKSSERWKYTAQAHHDCEHNLFSSRVERSRFYIEHDNFIDSWNNHWSVFLRSWTCFRSSIWRLECRSIIHYCEKSQLESSSSSPRLYPSERHIREDSDGNRNSVIPRWERSKIRTDCGMEESTHQTEGYSTDLPAETRREWRNEREKRPLNGSESARNEKTPDSYSITVYGIWAHYRWKIMIPLGSP